MSLTSSDSSKLVLSRTPGSLGTGTLVVSVPPGSASTQPFFLQARTLDGDVTLRAQVEGGPSQTVTIRIVNSWFACGVFGAESITVSVGTTVALACSPRFTASAGNPVQEVQPLPGLDPIALRSRSSDAGVFTVSPDSAVYRQGIEQFTIQGVGAGGALLTLEQPAGFGPAPDGALAVSVVLPAIRSGCSELNLGKDTQVTCEIFIGSGNTITAVSSDPSLVLVSNDPLLVGSGEALITGGRVTIQQLARYGTAEVVLRAPGFADLRITVVSAQSELRVVEGNSTSPAGTLTLRQGNVAHLFLSLLTRGVFQSTPRAGNSIVADLVVTPAGVVSVDRTRINFPANQQSVDIEVRAVAPGSAVIRLVAPADIAVSGVPIAATVSP